MPRSAPIRSPTLWQVLVEEHGLDAVQLRQAFEEMHRGKDFSRHYLRGTYQNPQVAALWNQHIRSIAWAKKAGLIR